MRLDEPGAVARHDEIRVQVLSRAHPAVRQRSGLVGRRVIVPQRETVEHCVNRVTHDLKASAGVDASDSGAQLCEVTEKLVLSVKRGAVFGYLLGAATQALRFGERCRAF